MFARFDDLLNAKLGIKAIAHLLTEVSNYYWLINCNNFNVYLIIVNMLI